MRNSIISFKESLRCAILSVILITMLYTIACPTQAGERAGAFWAGFTQVFIRQQAERK